jgi:Ni/Fe-hydrogenase subunit HybB-like protein
MFMLEKAVVGSRRYWGWTGMLAAVALVGFLVYLHQLRQGLGITGMSRDVTWGLYIAQFTFLVGIAASAVMVVLPYYLHDWKAFARITILGEALAISAVVTCLLFILVDMGQPARMLNIVRYPSPRSMMFWDMIALGGYLLLNITISVVTLGSEQRDVPPPGWIRPVILLSIPWAISIHTVTAFLYSGLPGRPLWLTALLAPRFLASAFASGPALLILLCLMLRRLTRFDPGPEPVQKLGLIVTYATAMSVFFAGLELFTVFYAQLPEHVQVFRYLYAGLDDRQALVPWTWTAALLAIAAVTLLLVPAVRRNERTLAVACVMIVIAVWVDKGITLIVGGFVPSPLGAVTEYAATWPEMSIAFGVWAFGALMLTVFYKIMVEVRQGDR